MCYLLNTQSPTQQFKPRKFKRKIINKGKSFPQKQGKSAGVLPIMFKALNVWRANSDITEPSSSKTLNDRYCHAEKTSISVAFVFFQKSHLFELLHLFNLYSLGISELLHWHITETVVKTNKSIHVCFQPGHTVCTNCVKLRKNWTWSEVND